VVRFGNFAAASATSLLLSDEESDGDDELEAPFALAQSAATISIEANADTMPPARLPTGFALARMIPHHRLR
jgi:hypothetical protein